jgi:hypothetical protein
MARMHRLIIGFSVSIATLLLDTQSVLACDCHDGGPVCEAFWKTPVVFVGRVEGVTPATPANTSSPRRRIRFRVIEGLRGTNAQEIDLFGYATSCDLSFAPGEEWIIYASPRADGPGLTTGTCSRSRPLKAATQDLAYARTVYSKPADKGRIFGRLTYSGKANDTPVPGVRLTFTGPWFEPVIALTDREGRYEVSARAAAYRLTATLPPGMSLLLDGHSIDLPDNRGCVVANLRAKYPGHVSGRVVTPSGAPVRNLTVELISVDGFDFASSRLRGFTDEGGRFTVSGVESGSYVAGIAIGHDQTRDGIEPRYLFAGGTTTKGAALRLQVDGGSQRAVGDLVLPQTVRVAQVTGLVVHSNGLPAADIKVRAKADFDEGDFAWTTIRTDSRGRFSFGLVMGMLYRIVAESAAAGARQDAVAIDPSQPLRTLRLVVH